MVGGGVLRLVNHTVEDALRHLGYGEHDRLALRKYLEQHGSFEGASQLRAEHLPVFDCAFPPPRGRRRIAPAGHVRMMAAVQPFLSGAISKTVNLPEAASVADIDAIYMQAWELGLKSIAVYRDGCKRAQPLRAADAAPGAPSPAPDAASPYNDAPACPMCGTAMVRSGPCFRCDNCGTSSACS